MYQQYQVYTQVKLHSIPNHQFFRVEDSQTLTYQVKAFRGNRKCEENKSERMNTFCWPINFLCILFMKYIHEGKGQTVNDLGVT